MSAPTRDPRVFPDSPPRTIDVNVVPVAHPVTVPPSPSKRQDPKRANTWSMAIQGTKGPDTVGPKSDPALQINNRRGFEDPSELDGAARDPVIDAISATMLGGGAEGGGLTVVPPSPRKAGLTIAEVVSAKAIAAKKRRATVESTKIDESVDVEGHKVVNQ